MNTEQIKKHEKAILVLEAIDMATNRILSYDTDLKRFEKSFWGVEWTKHRKETTIKVKERLQNYYNNNFKIK